MHLVTILEPVASFGYLFELPESKPKAPNQLIKYLKTRKTKLLSEKVEGVINAGIVSETRCPLQQLYKK